MRNFLFIFIIPAVFYNGCATIHVRITDIDYRWPNDWYLKSTGKLYSGKVLGYRDGTKQLYYSAYFKNGRLDGPRIRWYRNGNKWGEWEFNIGEVIEGSYELWEKNGEVVFDWLAESMISIIDVALPIYYHFLGKLEWFAVEKVVLC